MPFSIHKLSNGKYGIKKIKENEFTKKEFNTRQAAINMAFRYMEFRHEKPYQVGNKILNANNNDSSVRKNKKNKNKKTG